MDTKAAFESEIKSRGMSAMKRDGRYVDSATRFAFDFWTASRAEIEIELPRHCNGVSSEAAAYDDALDECIEAITYHGIRIKGKK